MIVKIWTLTTFDTDEIAPLAPWVFTSEAQALEELEREMRLFWADWTPANEDGSPMEFPAGDPWKAHEELSDFEGFPTYTLDAHDLPADPVRDAAPAMLAALKLAEGPLSRIAVELRKRKLPTIELDAVRAAIAAAEGRTDV